VKVHPRNWFTSCCSACWSRWFIIFLKHLVSSANVNNILRMFKWKMSLIYIRNSGGPRMLPWGTLDVTGNSSDEWLFIDTNWNRLYKYDWNQDQSLPVMPHDHSLVKSWLWDTESKALIYRVACSPPKENLKSILSSWAQVSSGVPQGSILGPLLFSLYANELPSLASCQLLMFADDIKLYHTIRSFEGCLMLQNDINILHDWSLFQNAKFYILVMLHTLAVIL